MLLFHLYIDNIGSVMKRTALSVVLLCIGLLSFAWILTAKTHTTVIVDNWVTRNRDVTKYREVNYPYSTSNTLNDKHFVVRKVLGMFAVNESVCSFNASYGYWIELDISVSSDDLYERRITLELTSDNHGVIFNVTANKFNQTVNLDHNDDYNITITKRSPFYTTLRVNGKIDVYHQETIWHDNWVNEQYQEQEPYQVNEAYLSEKVVNVFPTYFLIIPSSLILISIIIISMKPKKVKI